MNTVIQANLERCLRSPYLRRDERKRQEIGAELAAAQDLYNQAKTSFEAEDTTTGMKQAWGAIFRAARALVYAAGYDFDGLRCMEVVLEAHYLGKGLEAAVRLDIVKPACVLTHRLSSSFSQHSCRLGRLQHLLHFLDEGTRPC